MSKYAIVENGTPRRAGAPTIKIHLKEQGVKVSPATFLQWSEAKRNSLGVYTIIVIKEAVNNFQRLRDDGLSFVDGQVQHTFSAVWLPNNRLAEIAKEGITAIYLDRRIASDDYQTAANWGAYEAAENARSVTNYANVKKLLDEVDAATTRQQLAAVWAKRTDGWA